MARTLTSDQTATLQAQHRTIYTRAWVADSSGTLVDHSDAFVSATLNSTVDELVDQLTMRFERGTGASSYAPQMTADPPIDTGRAVVFEVAVMDPGDTPQAGDWFEIFRGMIEECDPTENPVEAIAFDQAGILNAAYIEEEREYGAEDGTDLLETVMQQILTDNATGVTLYVPTSPGAFVQSYRQQRESILQALRTLAESIGWTVRYRWDESTESFRLTLFEPPRTNTTPEWTTAPNRYLRVERFHTSATDVRNRIRIGYPDTDGVRQYVVGEDSASVTKYGGPNALARFMGIEEPTDSPIQTQAQAEYIRDAALSDLAEPDATHTVRDFCLPHLEVMDLVRFPANDVHYSAAQNLAVMGITHEFPAPGVGYTSLTCRGKPSGGVLMWRRRAKRAGSTAEPDGAT